MLRPCAGAAASLKSTSCVSSPDDVPVSTGRSSSGAARAQDQLCRLQSKLASRAANPVRVCSYLNR